MIISGGENVYPSEVEGLLGSHGQVKDVAVIGIPDGTWGECVHAVIVLHQSGSMSEQDLLEWCRGRIAGHKRPRSVSFIAEEDMPRTATGKILHRVLSSTLADLGSVGEGIFHALPDMARNFDTISARP